MIYADQLLWPLSVASGILAYFAYLKEMPVAKWLVIISICAGLIAVILGVIRKAVRTVESGLIGVAVALSAWFGYDLYRKAHKWMDGLTKTGWITASDIRFVKYLIILLPLIITVAVVLIITTQAWKSKKDYKPIIKPVDKKKALDVEVCKAEGKPIIIKHMDRYLHTMVIGTTGTGKSSRVLKPMIEQDLEAIAKGEKLGLTVIEPKGEFADDVAAMCRSMKVPYIYINPLNPATPVFNPMAGEPETVAEIMRTVLRSLFGKQEAFFRLNQEVMARNTALLVKRIKGEDATILDMTEALRDDRILAMYINKLERKEGETALTQYFKTEVMGDLKDKMQQFTLGLRLQLEDITDNQMMRRVMVGKSDVDLDKHLADGRAVLIINTAMGELGKLGDAFGQFIMMHFQQAVFRRKGTERTRTPHVLYIDEFPRYVNPDFERLLAIGRSYRCATVLALQATALIVHEDRPTFKDIVLETCRNKIVLTLGSEDDARRFSREFGEYEYIEHQQSYKRDGMLIYPWRIDSMRETEKSNERFNYTDLMELPRYHAVVRVVSDGEPQQPVLGKLELSKWDRDKNKRKKSRETDITVDIPKSDAGSNGIVIKIDNQMEGKNREDVSDGRGFFDF